MSLEHVRKHGLLIQEFEATNDPIEQLSILKKYMKDHAHDVQSFLHHIEQGSVYCGKTTIGDRESNHPRQASVSAS